MVKKCDVKKALCLKFQTPGDISTTQYYIAFFIIICFVMGGGLKLCFFFLLFFFIFVKDFFSGFG